MYKALLRLEIKPLANLLFYPRPAVEDQQRAREHEAGEQHIQRPRRPGDHVLIQAKQELDRYMFNSPGQAGSYFYGYSRLLQTRMDAELALGAKFDRLAFNNFVIGQGMLPPDLLAAAVKEQFVPQQLAKK